MKQQRKMATSTAAAAWLLAMTLVCLPFAHAVEPAMPSSVDVYWKATRSLAVPGVTTVIVLDEEIAHAQLGNDTIEFAGLTRGDTVALAYVGGRPLSIVVHVIEHPSKIIPPSLRLREAEMGHGIVGSDVQTSSGNSSSLAILDNFAWSQQVGDHFMSFTSQVEHNNQFGGPAANLRTGGLTYRTPGFSIGFLDFGESLTGATGEDRVNNFSSTNSVELRGLGVTFEHGRNEYSIFGGTTIPYRFLALNATRDVAGFSFHRKQTDKLNLFGSASYLNIPLALNTGIQRRNYFMQTAGASYHISKGFMIGGEAGVSTGGGKLLRGDASYTSYRFAGYASAVLVSQTFPLSQVQSLFSGTSTFRAGGSYRTNSRLTEGLYYEHTNVSPGLIYRFSGSSDYLSPNFSFLITPGETLAFSYTYSRNNGGFNPVSTTSGRYDISLGSRITQRMSNTAQFTLGSIQDPLQISSQDQFTIRDSISIPIKGQALLLGVEHDRVQPSLLSKLSQEIDLLSPALQAQFQSNPTAFIDSSNFPPEVKALLAAEQPIGTTISASTNLSLGSKLRLSPNVSVTHSSQGQFANSWTETFGYSLSYAFRPTLQFRSSLSNILLWDAHSNTSQRSTVLSFGFLKNFSSAPGALPWAHHSRIIEGRVFRDNNINGVFNLGEPGIAGVEVRLDNGQMALTDEQGRYKFPSVSADQHEVSIALTQFRHPVRMTTHSEAQADLIQQRIAVVNFGILDFARVMGSVYNDLRFENRRQVDSKGMQNIDLLLADGKEVRKIQTSGSGDFEVDNVSPGDYKLSIDPSSLPANYVAPDEGVAIHVSPVSTVVRDIPMRALRSISGRLILKTASVEKSDSPSAPVEKQGKSKAGTPAPGMPKSEEFKLVPVSGVEIIAGPATSVTDKDGNFLLRNLPAGDLTVTIRPVKAVPDGLKIPSGAVKLPADPVQIQGATIVITNADLLRYLTLEFPPLPGQKEEPKVVAEAVAPQKQEKPTAIARSNAALAKSVQPDTQRVAGATESGKTDAPMVAEIVIPAHLHPAATLLRIPAVSPNSPVVAPMVRASVLPSESAAQSTSSSNAVQGICANVTSLADAARCIKQMKRNAAMGTQQ